MVGTWDEEMRFWGGGDVVAEDGSAFFLREGRGDDTVDREKGRECCWQHGIDDAW